MAKIATMQSELSFQPTYGGMTDWRKALCLYESYGFAVTGLFRASGNMMVNMVLTIVSLWVLQFPLAYVLSKHTALGATGIYWSMTMSTVAITLITAGIYVHGGWRKKRLLDDEEVLTAEVTEEILVGEGGR